jgi:UDP-N-acetylmuramoyl-L-alanyl-D-glutamate--2,6-diaminopimelate ligase
MAAVYSAMDSAERGDVVVISGKGPEKTLRIGSLSIDYSDYNAVRSWSIERGVRML